MEFFDDYFRHDKENFMALNKLIFREKQAEE